VLSAYEKLSKISVVTGEIGRVDEHLLPIIFAATDTIASNFSGANVASSGLNVPGSINANLSKFISIVNSVRKVVAFSSDHHYSTWVSASGPVPDSFRANFSEGTGVIEFTNVTTLSTTTTLNFAGGTFNLTFSDPYEIMLITNKDIEQAIHDAVNVPYSNSYTQLGITSLGQNISSQTATLNSNRQSRSAPPIIFSVQQNTYSGSTVSAVISGLGLSIIFDSSGNIDPSALSSTLGTIGLTSDDIPIFQNIINMFNSQISSSANARQKAMADNQDVKKQLNGIRKKLRLHYGNKLLIQPMDNVHIYIDSKKKVERKIMSGIQS